MEIKDLSKGRFRTRLLVDLTFSCTGGVTPPPEHLNKLVKSAEASLKNLERSHTESWSLDEVVVDSFPPSSIMSHPFQILQMLLELMATISTWARLATYTSPLLVGLTGAADDLGTIYQRLQDYIRTLPEVLEEDDAQEHFKGCPRCAEQYRELKESLAAGPEPEVGPGEGGMAN